MSTTDATPYAGLAYNELKKLAAERSLDTKGTKDELIARLQAAEGSTSAPTAPATKAPSAPLSSHEVDKAYKSDAEKMKANLDAQPKVMVFIPFEAGENPEQAAKVKFIVNLNGYQLDIPRGTAVEVPQQVARIVAERLESEGRAGRNHLISGNAAKQEALS